MFNIDCFFVLVFGVWQQLDSDMDGNYDTSSHDWAGTEKASASAIFAQTDPLHNRYTHCTICVPLLRCTDATRESCISRSQLRNQAQSCECKDLLGDWQPRIESQQHKTMGGNHGSIRLACQPVERWPASFLAIKNTITTTTTTLLIIRRIGIPPADKPPLGSSSPPYLVKGLGTQTQVAQKKHSVFLIC